MSKGIYVGVNNVAREVKAIYVGVNGVARKVSSAYIGVNGFAQQCSQSVVLPGNVALSSFSVSDDSEYGLFTVTENLSGGELSVASSNDNIATASVDGNTIKVTPGTETGDVTVTVTSAASGNYLEASTTSARVTKANFEVTANNRGDIGYTSGVRNLVIPKSFVSGNTWNFITRIGGFDDTGLLSVTIPDGVTSIEAATFCLSSLESIVLPASVTTIGYKAFMATDLTDVYYAGSESDWANISIDGNNDELLDATIHYNSTGPS